LANQNLLAVGPVHELMPGCRREHSLGLASRCRSSLMGALDSTERYRLEPFKLLKSPE
jgi:hypothetical protein